MAKFFKYCKKYTFGEKEEYIVQASSKDEALEQIKDHISYKGGFSDTVSGIYIEEIEFNKFNIIEI